MFRVEDRNSLYFFDTKEEILDYYGYDKESETCEHVKEFDLEITDCETDEKSIINSEFEMSLFADSVGGY